MRRGEIWTIAGGGDYTGKARPVVVLQDDRFDATESVTICALTTDPTDAPLFRIPVEPTEANGLDVPSRLMVDTITTVRRIRLGKRVGTLENDTVTLLNRAILVFLGMTSSRRVRAEP
jgi:mRNA interferase MazF